ARHPRHHTRRCRLPHPDLHPSTPGCAETQDAAMHSTSRLQSKVPREHHGRLQRSRGRRGACSGDRRPHHQRRRGSTKSRSDIETLFRTTRENNRHAMVHHPRPPHRRRTARAHAPTPRRHHLPRPTRPRLPLDPPGHQTRQRRGVHHAPARLNPLLHRPLRHHTLAPARRPGHLGREIPASSAAVPPRFPGNAHRILDELRQALPQSPEYRLQHATTHPHRSRRAEFPPGCAEGSSA
ncbi:hypothetical protein LTR48_008498, partial [Friedmanniomyces endolithicus]